MNDELIKFLLYGDKFEPLYDKLFGKLMAVSVVRGVTFEDCLNATNAILLAKYERAKNMGAPEKLNDIYKAIAPILKAKGEEDKKNE
jgi:hypothetical protein